VSSGYRGCAVIAASVPARAGRGHRDAVDGQARKIGVELRASPAVLHLGPGDAVCGNGPDLRRSLPGGCGPWCLTLVNGTTRDAPGAALVFPPGMLGEKVDRLPRCGTCRARARPRRGHPSAGGPCCKTSSEPGCLASSSTDRLPTRGARCPPDLVLPDVRHPAAAMLGRSTLGADTDTMLARLPWPLRRGSKTAGMRLAAAVWSPLMPHLTTWPEGRELWRRSWLVFCLSLIIGEEACADGEQAQVR
jgi:hypothetical protein